MTSAPEISEPPRFWPTGNLWLSLPEISLDDGSVRSLAVLLERVAGLVVAHGGPDGLLRPEFTVNGTALALTPDWRREGNWVPHLHGEWEQGEADAWYCAPVGERGATFRLSYRNLGPAPAQVELAWAGSWATSSVALLRVKPLHGEIAVHDDAWTGSRVAALSAGLPVLAIAVQGGDGVIVRDSSPAGDGPQGWRALRAAEVPPGGQLTADVFVSVAPEADGAAVTALHLRRRGFDALLKSTLDWLSARALRLPADAEPAIADSGVAEPGAAESRVAADAGAQAGLGDRLNANLFFNYFFAQGDCLDTGRPVIVTSRSPHYYVCAAFWSRDAFWWTFPALLLTDQQRARRVLVSSLAAARSLVADHALYFNGTPLYPGFELDQAAAPVLAVWRYVQVTGDRGVLAEPAVARAVELLPATVAAWRHSDWELYGTFLLPTDDPTDYPYVTTCNAMLAAAFDAAAELSGATEASSGFRPAQLRERAAAIRAEIRARLVTDGPHGPMWAWACDADGKPETRDEPPLGLRTLPYWGLAESDDPVQVATRKWLTGGYEYHYAGPFPGAGAPHFPHPSGFDLANRLLDGDDSLGDPLAALAVTPMDQGLACESWDPKTGRVRTGAAMASMGGLLAWAAWARLTGHHRWDQLLTPDRSALDSKQ